MRIETYPEIEPEEWVAFLKKDLAPPRLKLFTSYGSIKVYVVDGSWIRTNKDEDFTDFGQHQTFPFIPQDEFWLDVEKDPGDAQFYIDNMTERYKLMAGGMSYEKASDAGDRLEEREREKSLKIKTGRKLGRLSKPPSPEILAKIQVKSLGLSNDGVHFWMADGDTVRARCYVRWTEGGHDLVYPFTPKKTVWIDNDLVEEEIPLVCLHEKGERDEMAGGMEYDPAHAKISLVEEHCRHYPEDLKGELNKRGIYFFDKKV